MAEQNLEKFVFVRRQMNFGPADDHAPGSKINADISKIHSLCSVVLVQYGRTAEAGTNTRGYFTWIERFADVVVGPSIETFYFVAFLSPGRDDDDWDVRPAAYLANNIYSVSVRQAQIKKD